MSINAALLRFSFKIVSRNSDEMAARFYEILFERFPDVRPLFAETRMEDQKRKLMVALAIIVNKVDDPGFLFLHLQRLGRTHIAYGALPEHYDAVGECLLSALAEAMGNLWTEEIERNWAEAYGAIKAQMLEGAVIQSPVLA